MVGRERGTRQDAVVGVVPGEVVRPASVAEVVEVLRSATAEARTVVPVGGRSKLGWAAPPTSCDLLLDTTGLDRVVEHTAGDLVVVAEAGVRLADLQQQVGAANQLLGLDPPEPGATLGGVVSANASGPRRLRYGTVRDLLIGVTVVLADGTTAHAGGKVVKNVAGYDLGKLYTGAHGTLGVVVSTTWRLHPAAPAQRVVVAPVADHDDAGRLAVAVARSTMTPSAVELVGTTGGALALVVLFESIAESVDHQSALACALTGGEDVAALPDAFGRRPGGEGDLVLRIAHVPSALAAVLSALPEGSAVSSSACTGVTYAAMPGGQGIAALPGLRAAISPYDGTAAVLAVPQDLRDGLDHWGPVGDALPLMRRVKDRFDPARLLSPGRYVGGL